MASVSPFQRVINRRSYFIQQRVQIFKCTRVFNHLLLSGHERQACQSNPSSTRRLNRGNCYTPKFSLPLLKTFHISILKDFTRVDQINPLLSNQPKLGFGHSQINVGLQHFKCLSCIIICFKESPCQNSSLTSQVCSDNCSDG